MSRVTQPHPGTQALLSRRYTRQQPIHDVENFATLQLQNLELFETPFHPQEEGDTAQQEGSFTSPR
jgi:hypothetical protein